MAVYFAVGASLAEGVRLIEGVRLADESFFEEGRSLEDILRLLGVSDGLGLTSICDCRLFFNFSSDSSRSFCLRYR